MEKEEEKKVEPAPPKEAMKPSLFSFSDNDDEDEDDDFFKSLTKPTT